MGENYCLTSKDLVETAMKVANKNMDDFKVDPYVMIVFSGSLLEYLKEKANLVQSDWLAPFHPYGGTRIHRGKYDNLPITVMMPQMGASPMASVAEDLIFCGAKVILLVCGSWGISDKVKLLDFIIPTHALGPDGTSIHYGRKFNEEIELNKEILNIFIEEKKKKKYKIPHREKLL